MNCRICGRSNRNEATFCAYCGSPMRMAPAVQAAPVLDYWQAPQKKVSKFMLMVIVLVVQSSSRQWRSST